MPWSYWSRGEKIGTISLVVGIIGAIAAVLVVPEFREFVGWDAFFIREIAEERAKRKLAEHSLREAQAETDSAKVARQKIENQLYDAKSEIKNEKAARDTLEKQLQDAQAEIENERAIRQSFELKVQETNQQMEHLKNQLYEMQASQASSEKDKSENGSVEYYKYSIFRTPTSCANYDVNMKCESIEYLNNESYGCVTVLNIAFTNKKESFDCYIYRPLSKNASYIADQDGTPYNFIEDKGSYNDRYGDYNEYYGHKLKPLVTWRTKWYFAGCINSSTKQLNLFYDSNTKGMVINIERF